jgi:hypothetical protein
VLRGLFLKFPSGMEAKIERLIQSMRSKKWSNGRTFMALILGPLRTDTIKGFPHQTFRDTNGDAVVETFSITGMDHGQPVDPGTGGDQCGAPDQFIINEHICASFFTAKFWGLLQ